MILSINKTFNYFDMSTLYAKVLYMIAILNETYIEELGLDYMRKPIVYLSAYSLTAGSGHAEFE